MKRPTKSPPPGSTRLFAEPHAPTTPTNIYTAHIDGASRGNPGPASYAVVIQAPDGRKVLELGKYLGRDTNNVAEYYALITALDYAASHEIARLRVRSDSELLVRQMQGRYKVKSADLKPLFERASKLARSLEYFSIEHVRREQNPDADRLANEALDRTGSVAAGPPKQLHAKPGHRDGHSRTTRVRAHYVNGVLIPFEPLELPEGAEIEFDLPASNKSTV